MNQNNNNRRRRNPQNNRQKSFKPHNYKAVNAVVPFKIGGNMQLVAVPPVNNQLHIRRWIRVIQGTGPTAITLSMIVVNSLQALGISLAAQATGTFAIHTARFFSMENLAGVNPFMGVTVHDIEETGNPKVADFTAASTVSGISHVQIAHPVNNRPTFSNTTTPALVYANVTGVGEAARVIVDLEMTVVINI